ncbi:hypothetical protein [Candidatus Frankia alpina]|uniref:hypothetical protein n=1 Tax=Candidatus Frankia alpina TaxID=2699483 RepID=UPI001386819B|nr:hypothetical protein [Candidatus Frankia alpina]
MGELSALLPADRMVAAFRRIVTDPVDGSMLDADGGSTRTVGRPGSTTRTRCVDITTG